MSQSATNLLRGHVQPERSGVATIGPTIKIGNSGDKGSTLLNNLEKQLHTANGFLIPGN